MTSRDPAVANAAKVQIGTSGLADNSVTSAQIAIDAVDSAEIKANAVTTAKIADDSVTSAKLAAPTLTTKSTAFTLALADENCTLRITAAMTVTVPDSDIAFPNGAVVTLFSDVADVGGVGQVLVGQASGVSVNSSNGKRLRTRYSMATLVKISNTEWVLSGDTVT
jgi:hypothetical protein